MQNYFGMKSGWRLVLPSNLKHTYIYTQLSWYSNYYDSLPSSFILCGHALWVYCGYYANTKSMSKVLLNFK